ncbi:MAG TPA: hypothetical protein VIB00_04150 [Pyrinomonadaceae bacterium]
MKQVKSLFLTATMVCTLFAGVQAGDMGSPGIKTVPCTKTVGLPANPPMCEKDDAQKPPNSSNANQVLVEILLALLRLM